MYQKKDIETLKDPNGAPLPRKVKDELVALLCRPRHKGGNSLKGKILLAKVAPTSPLASVATRSNRDARTVRALTVGAIKHAITTAHLCGDEDAVVAALDMMGKAKEIASSNATDHAATAKAIEKLVDECKECGLDCLDVAAASLEIAAKYAENLDVVVVEDEPEEEAPKPKRTKSKGATKKAPTGGTKTRSQKAAAKKKSSKKK